MIYIILFTNVGIWAVLLYGRFPYIITQYGSTVYIGMAMGCSAL